MQSQKGSESIIDHVISYLKWRFEVMLWKPSAQGQRVTARGMRTMYGHEQIAIRGQIQGTKSMRRKEGLCSRAAGSLMWSFGMVSASEWASTVGKILRV